MQTKEYFTSSMHFFAAIMLQRFFDAQATESHSPLSVRDRMTDGSMKSPGTAASCPTGSLLPQSPLKHCLHQQSRMGKERRSVSHSFAFCTAESREERQFFQDR